MVIANSRLGQTRGFQKSRPNVKSLHTLAFAVPRCMEQVFTVAASAEEKTRICFTFHSRLEAAQIRAPSFQLLAARQHDSASVSGRSESENFVRAEACQPLRILAKHGNCYIFSISTIAIQTQLCIRRMHAEARTIICWLHRCHPDPYVGFCELQLQIRVFIFQILQD